MKRALLTLSLLAFAAAAQANPPYAKVNGKPIPANRAEIMQASLIAQGQAKSPDLDKAIKEELVRREVLAQAAVAKGLDKKSDVQAQADLARQGVLIGAYLNDYANSVKISDDDVRKEYETVKGVVGDKEYKARHILVDKEDEAKAIVDKLKKGEKFEELAKASKDPGSKDRGGELGWAGKTSYVPPFAEAMAKLAKGKFTEMPVQSNYGWHVIQLDDVRDMKAPGFDEVKPQLVQRMRQQAVEKHILDLRAKAKVE